MKKQSALPVTVEAYIAGFPPAIRARLRQVRAVVRRAAPEAVERISYRMPSLELHGALVYYAAFQGHIGFFPPVDGDARLLRALAPYANERGNLRFLHDEPLPLGLIARVTRQRLRQNLARAAARTAAVRRRTRARR
jgi:uncharacterized protein YdhG (YjbR/CyaY superfamily)